MSGYWYYPTNKYTSEADKDNPNDIDADETGVYEIDEYSWMFKPIEENNKGRPRSRRTSLSKEDRERVLSLALRRCSTCGKPEDLQIHHIDRDRSNNRISNLKVVCYTCHKKIHKKLKLIEQENEVE